MSRLLDDSDGERIPRYEHNDEQVLLVKFVMQWSKECSMIMSVLCHLIVAFRLAEGRREASYLQLVSSLEQSAHVLARERHYDHRVGPSKQ